MVELTPLAIDKIQLAIALKYLIDEIRKWWPALDGRWVHLVVGIMAVVAVFLRAYVLDTAPPAALLVLAQDVIQSMLMALGYDQATKKKDH